MTAAGAIMLLAALTFAAALVGFGWTIGAIVADSCWAWLTEPAAEPEPERCEATTIYQPAFERAPYEVQCEEDAGHAGMHLYTAPDGAVTWTGRPIENPTIERSTRGW